MEEGRLSVQEVVAEGGRPAEWVMMLHGIYGAGRNWGAVARGVTRARPDRGVLLVDLRQHGESTGFAAPHTVEAAAADLGSVEVPGRLGSILGHSFGGKVALAHARDREEVRQVWVVDSTPAAREPEGGAWNMLAILRRVPGRYAEREEAVAALVAEGVERPIALWMTTNLDWTGTEYRWKLDFEDMEALLRSFFALDLWPVVDEPPERLEVHIVKATRSSILDSAAAERVREAGRRTGRVYLHEVEGGHWLNADNPDAVVALLAEHL